MTKRSRAKLFCLDTMRIAPQENRIFTGDAKKHRVNRIMDVLKDWRLSPFENEGAIHAEIRSSLCLQGYAWQRSDQEATSLINNAFMLMGIERPTWEQGQREYVEPRENCKWCGGALPENSLTIGKKFRFCSASCARSAFEQRSFQDRKHYDRARGEVYRIFNRAKAELKTCATCGNSFHPDRTTKGLYCSMKCAGIARRIFIDKPCKNCGTEFRPKQATDQFCCVPCWREYQAEKMPLAKCDYCRKSFHKKFEHARFCSVSCRQKMSELVTGRRIPKRITPPVFDYFFARAA